MPPTHADLNPSRHVERIREILVGRQMDRVERRLERLEAHAHPLRNAGDGSVFEIRLIELEKRQDEKLASLRDEMDAEKARQVEETHRLARQIQAVARNREESELEAQVALEGRFSRWLDHWNQGFRRYLEQREQHLVSELRGELEQTRAWVDTQLASRRRETDGTEAATHLLRESFHRLAEAARAVADAADRQANSSPPALAPHES